jgi:hypothetical protein
MNKQKPIARERRKAKQDIAKLSEEEAYGLLIRSGLTTVLGLFLFVSQPYFPFPFQRRKNFVLPLALLAQLMGEWTALLLVAGSSTTSFQGAIEIQ